MLKRFCKSLLLGLIITVMCANVVLASWAYLYPINVIETANTSRTYYPVLFDFGGTQLYNQGLIASNGTNTNMQIGSTNAKYMVSTTNIAAIIPSIASGSVNTLSLYTGYSPLQPYFSIIPGYGGNVSVTDNPSIELGSNFSVSQTGYIDTSAGANKTIVYKPGAFRTYIASAGNITSIAEDVVKTPPSTSAYLSENGTGNWQVANVTDGNTATQAFHCDASGIGTWVMIDFGATNLTALTEWDYYTSAAVQAIWDIQYSSDNVSWTSIYTGLDLSTGAGWHTATWNNTASYRYWRSYKTNGANPGSYVTELRVLGVILVSATSITSGNHTVTTTADSTNLSIYVDSVLKDTTPIGQVVPNTANNWLICVSNTTPYTDNFTISVNGTQKLWLNPNVMLIGNSIPDRSGFGNTGTINWGANSGLSIFAGELVSFAQNEATTNQTAGFTVSGATMPSTWFANGSNLSQLPFYDAFLNVANQTGQPVQTYYFQAAIGLAFGAFILLVILTRSALIGYLAMLIIFGIGASMTVVPAWIVFALAVTGAAVMYLYKQFQYGG